MASETILYGYVESATYTSQEYRKYQKINLEVIRRLPAEDEYPYLSRHMFSAAPANYSRGTFRVQVIHFGGSMRGLEWGDVDIWISKFQGLLEKLYWFSAVAHLIPEIDSDYQFVWNPKHAPVTQHEEHGKLLPVTEWTRKKIYGGKLVECT